MTAATSLRESTATGLEAESIQLRKRHLKQTDRRREAKKWA